MTKSQHSAPNSPKDTRSLPKAKPISLAGDKEQAWMGGFNAIVQAAYRIGRNPLPLLFMTLLYMILDIGLGIINYGPSVENLNLAQTIVPFILFVLAIPTYALAVADNERLSAIDPFRGDIGKYVVVLLVTLTSILATGAAVFAFVVPIMWVLPWVSLAMYIATDSDKGLVESLAQSYRMARHHKAQIWGIIGYLLVGMIVLSIALAVAQSLLSSNIFTVVDYGLNALSTAFSIVGSAAMAMLYRWLQRVEPVE